MSDKEPFEYTADDFVRDVGGKLTDNEIAMLADNFPTYRIKNWRMTLLDGIKNGKKNWQILIAKLEAKEIDIQSGFELGGHETMIPHKIRRAAIRLQYLRYRRKGRTRTQADKDVRINHFPDVKTGTIEFNTRGCLLDKKET